MCTGSKAGSQVNDLKQCLTIKALEKISCIFKCFNRLIWCGLLYFICVSASLISWTDKCMCETRAHYYWYGYCSWHTIIFNHSNLHCYIWSVTCGLGLITRTNELPPLYWMVRKLASGSIFFAGRLSYQSNQLHCVVSCFRLVLGWYIRLFHGSRFCNVFTEFFDSETLNHLSIEAGHIDQIT